jgi:molecular chaperone DnaK (HSP70)
MREEDENLGVSDTISTHGTATPDANVARKSADAEPPHPEGAPDIDNDNVETNVQETEHTLRPSQERLDGQEIDDTDSETHTDADNNTKQTEVRDQSNQMEEASDVELERELDKLYLGPGHPKNDHPQLSAEGKPKIGAAKAKRQKRAEKQAALEAEDKSPQKPRKNRKPFDPSAAVQKARGETVTTGKRAKKK